MSDHGLVEDRILVLTLSSSDPGQPVAVSPAGSVNVSRLLGMQYNNDIS